MNQKIFALLVILVISVSLVSSATDHGLTASIGNARMVLRAKVGDTINRNVLINNVNNVSVDISSFASGDLENYTIIRNPNFSLSPNEQRNISFEIKVAKAGTTDTKINVKFASQEQKSGVGLSSNIIIIANETGEVARENSDSSSNNSSIDFSGISGLLTNPFFIGVAITLIIFVAFIVVLVIFLKKGSNEVQEEKLKQPFLKGLKPGKSPGVKTEKKK